MPEASRVRARPGQGDADVDPSPRRQPSADNPPHVASGDYAELKRLISARGLLERGPLRYLGHAVSLSAVFAVVLAGVALTRGGWWVVAWAAPAAFLSGQLGFLAHDATFPAMPRCRLREAAPLVREFCRERGVGYRETGIREAYLEVYRHLEAVAMPLRRLRRRAA